MALNYTRMQATATRLITENGLPMVHRQRTDGPYDPLVDGPTLIITDHNVNGVVLRRKEKDDDFALSPGTAISRDARKILITHLGGVQPAPGDEMLFNSLAWKVVYSREINPNQAVVTHYVLFVDNGIQEGLTV